MTRMKIAAAAALASGLFALAQGGAEARIQCDGNFQIVRGQPVSTLYCPRSMSWHAWPASSAGASPSTRSATERVPRRPRSAAPSASTTACGRFAVPTSPSVAATGSTADCGSPKRPSARWSPWRRVGSAPRRCARAWASSLCRGEHGEVPCSRRQRGAALPSPAPAPRGMLSARRAARVCRTGATARRWRRAR